MSEEIFYPPNYINIHLTSNAMYEEKRYLLFKIGVIVAHLLKQLWGP